MNGFSLSVGQPDAPLHAAAHSHHPWPDVTFTAQQDAWRDAARLLDRKWEHIFGTVIPAAQAHIARRLNLPDPATVTFGPNTHGFVLRILSCLNTPARILTTSSEFLSASRQIARLEEDGAVIVTRVPTEPFDTFEIRFAAAAAQGGHDLVFLSQVFFDSGYAVRDLAKIVDAVPDPETFVVIDGYHGFMAVPADFAARASRAFYLAGGYKYAMAGEGACFLHCPPGYGARPRDTGWYAGFGALESGGTDVPYAADGSRFLGATFDATALYRFNAVQDWLANRSIAEMLEQVRGIERAFLAGLTGGPLDPSQLLVPDESRRGRFLCFRAPDAAAITSNLATQNILVDHRADRLRIGFGIYHTPEDAMRLAKALRT
ncbi:MAG TPA: aminotransferase class V-fold PLP-dependent enzyme [Rhizomicrobium sp.]|jgi:selenocysteine lyase/cysteine desulfurase|nr:aminotransferase class V-fold PLP-dependent enzyme [Rhizomicrobium sp.]